MSGVLSLVALVVSGSSVLRIDDLGWCDVVYDDLLDLKCLNMDTLAMGSVRL